MPISVTTTAPNKPNPDRKNPEGERRRGVPKGAPECRAVGRLIVAGRNARSISFADIVEVAAEKVGKVAYGEVLIEAVDVHSGLDEREGSVKELSSKR
jgi:hypothetical protein